MSRHDGAVGRLDAAIDRLPLVDGRATLFVGVLTLLALLARLVFLGDRIAHYDEGRVGYWSLHFLETGEFHYRYIIHGPFVQHVNRLVFGTLGANDFTMRLIVALVGGLLPLSVLLFREHLRTSEMVGVAVFLSFNPILLYYSRFFRSTVPVAAFSFVAFGFLVRLYDTRRPRHLYAAAAFLGLALAAKENAVVYGLVWVGATALVLDHRLFRPGTARTGVDRLLDVGARHLRDRQRRRAMPRHLAHLLGATLLFLAVVLYFYAPRAGQEGGFGLWNALSSGQLQPLIDATWQDMREGFEYWFGGSVEEPNRHDTIFDRYLAFLETATNALARFALPLLAFALVGFLAERYATKRRSNLVMFASYWGVVSVFGYPLGSDIPNAWITVNALVPLTIPAGVGLASFYRWARGSYLDGDGIGLALVVLLLVPLLWHAVPAGVNGVYLKPQSPDNELVQFAQPASHMRPTLHDLRDLAGENPGTDLLFYGETLVNRGGRMAPGCTEIRNTLPLEWYVAIYDANASCATDIDELDRILEDRAPPVVVTTRREADEVRTRLPGYDERTHQLRAPGGRRVFFVDVANAGSHQGDS